MNVTTNGSPAPAGSTGRRARHVPAAIAASAALIVLALILYATELSRAAGVAVVAFALCLLAATLFARVRKQWPPRAWMIAFGALALAMLGYALWLYADGQMHPPMAS